MTKLFVSKFMHAEIRKMPETRTMARQLAAILVGVAMVPSICYGAGLTNRMADLFGSKGKNMNDVVERIAELPEKHKFTIRGLDFSPDGGFVAVASTDRIVRIWDWKNEKIHSELMKASGANDGFSSDPIKFSPDGQWLIACHAQASEDVVIRVWDTKTWRIAKDITDPVAGGCTSIAFTPDSSHLIRSSNRNRRSVYDNVIVYSVANWEVQWTARIANSWPMTISVSPNGRFLACGAEVRIETGGVRGEIAIIDLEQHIVVRRISNTVSFFMGQLAWSPDGRFIAAIGSPMWDGSANNGSGGYVGSLDTVMIFDAQTGEQVVGTQWGKGRGGRSLRYSPDGKYLVEGDENGKGTGLGARIWDGMHRTMLQEVAGNVGSLAISRDGRYLAVGSEKKTTIWKFK